MSHSTNIFEAVPSALPDELTVTLAASGQVRGERIVSLGHASPEGFRYDQSEHEFVLLVKGAARLKFDDEVQSVELEPGDYLTIPAHRRHRVEWASPDEPTVWLAVHYG